MYNSISYIMADLESQESLAKQYRHKLLELPKGKLSTSTIRGTTYYYKLVDGKKLYLGKADCEEVKLLQTRAHLTEALKRIERNCTALHHLLEEYQSVEPDIINSKIPKAYQFSKQNDYQLTNWLDLQDWGSAEYDKNTKYPEKLIHRTVKGECVRSKSEVIIADILFLKGIEYHYEENLTLGKETIAPDLKVAVASQRRFRRLEHFGMLSSSKYLEECLWKLRLYFSYKFVPWDDIIFTFEAQDGGIDAQTISWNIDQFCV